MLDLFAEYDRVGVPFTQLRYFPINFDQAVRLADFHAFEKDWPKTNRDRGNLIDKDIDGTITPDEAARLEALQAYAAYYIQTTTPRPKEAIDELEAHVFGGSAKKDVGNR